MKLQFTECGLSAEEADVLRVGLAEYSDVFAYSSESEDDSATTISGPMGTSGDQEYGTLGNQFNFVITNTNQWQIWKKHRLSLLIR
jgi:hypothetical protein